MRNTTLTPELYTYLCDISVREHPVMEKLRKKTANLALAHMQVAPDQAQLLQFLMRSIGAKRVLEIGTFTGYSALAMALALPDDGHLITCDINSEWTAMAHPYWHEANVDKKIELRLAPALQTLNDMLANGDCGSFDFIFIDADKTNYVQYYEIALKLMQPNGMIAIDNIFWRGNVLDTTVTNAQTREIRKLNDLIKNDQRIELSLLPVGDGLFLIQKSRDSKIA